MATLNKSPSKNLRAVFFMACVILIVFNSYALAHIDVTAEQARDLIDSTNDLVVVDVREPFEYCDDVGHIPRALNYPLSSGVLEARYEELPIDGPILVVCRSGGRSNVAANFLDSKGFSMVYDMLGGMSAWEWETEPCKDNSDSETADSAEKNTYVFRSDQSIVVQTGGIAGVHWTYSVEGLFQLSVDPNSGTASFAYVDANATDDSPLRRTLDPNEVFNMTSLVGAFLDDTTISFTGKADDGSDVLITVTIEDDLAYLVGETIPPPNTADFFLFSLDAVAQRKYDGGTGEPNDPYRIATAEDLMLLGDSPEDYDKHFILTADIDLDPNLPGRKVFYKAVIAPNTNDAESWFNGTPFTGVFDGNGNKISNLSCDSTDTNYIGLFGYVGTWEKEAMIKELGLIDPNIDTGTGSYVGSLIGELNKGTITDCYAEGGNIVGGNDVGGLVGAYGGIVMSFPEPPPFTISNCYSTSSVKGISNVGGLVGMNSVGRITNSYATGNVSGKGAIGGLVGQNGKMGDYFSFPIPGTILNCHSTGFVSGQSNVGGLIGLHAAGTVNGCFWDIETSAQTTSDGGIGLTTVEMQTSGTFLDAGWDFVDETENGTDDIWWILEGQDYPRLWWEP